MSEHNRIMHLRRALVDVGLDLVNAGLHESAAKVDAALAADREVRDG